MNTEPSYLWWGGFSCGENMSEQLSNQLHQPEHIQRSLKGLGELVAVINDLPIAEDRQEAIWNERRQELDERGYQILSQMSAPPIEIQESQLRYEDLRDTDAGHANAYYVSFAHAARRVRAEQAAKAAVQSQVADTIPSPGLTGTPYMMSEAGSGYELEDQAEPPYYGDDLHLVTT